MKEFVAESGGRYTYADDILNLQEMILALSGLFAECSNFVISGCRAEGVNISPGYVWINGKVRRFEGCADASYPYYIYEKNANESVVYANEANKRGRCCYMALGGGSVPQSEDAVTGKLPQFIEVREEYTPRLLDKFFGRYAVMIDSPFTRQTVNKDLQLTGTLAVEKGIESRHSLLVAPTASNYVLRGHFPAAGMAQIEACQGPTVKGALRLNAANGEVSILSRGVVSALFYESSCRVTDLSATTARIGVLHLSGGNIVNFAESGDSAAVRINYTGYQNGTSDYRNFEVYDGKKCANPLLRVSGKARSVFVDACLGVDATRGITLFSLSTKTERDFEGSIRWHDLNDDLTASVGYAAGEVPLFSLRNALGGIVLAPKDYVDVQGELRVGGVSIARTYATQQALADGLRGKVDSVQGKGLSTCDFTQALHDKLAAIADGAFAGDDTPQKEGYVTSAQVASELRKKADRLLGGLDTGERQTAAANLGVATKSEADGRYGRLTELFQDFITYLVSQGKSSTDAQQILRGKLGAAGSRELAEGYLRRDERLTDLLLADDEARKTACRTIGAAYAPDYQSKLLDTGWMQMANSGSGTDTRELFIRQIGNIVCIQGRINTARRDGSNEGGIVAVIPNVIPPPKYGLRTTMAHWNDDHKYNRGSSFTIDGGSRQMRIYERGMYDTTININFAYMV